MDGVLEHAGVVAERKEMADPNLRHDVSASAGTDRISGRQVIARRAFSLSVSKTQDSAWPFAPRSSIGSPHRRACAWHAGGRRRSADRRSRGPSASASPKGTRMPQPVAQQFLGMPVGRRHDGLSQSETVGQRARRHLGFIEIGRRVDVAHRNEVQQRGLIHELVEKDDMVLDAEAARTRAVRLSR